MTTQLPTYLQNRQSRNLAQTALANIGTGSPPYLSIQGGRFTLIDIAGNERPATKIDPNGNMYVDVVIVDINDHVSKIFFGLDKPFDPNTPTPPVCFSDNGQAPSQAASQPQSPTCMGCAHNVWGSKISQMGSQVKQCADQQKIAVFVPEYSDGVFLLRIPPGSFINWRAYMTKFAGSGLEPDLVITRISFESNVIGTLTFASPGYISEQMAPHVAKIVESHAADVMIGRLDKPRILTGVQTPVAIAAPAPFVAASAASPPALLPLSSVPAVVQPTAPVAPARRGRKPRSQQPNGPQAGPVQAVPQAPVQPVQQAPFRPDPPPAQQQFGIATDAPTPPAGLDLDAIFKS